MLRLVDEAEISELENFFVNIYNKKLLKVTQKTFQILLKDIISEDLINGLFYAFDENGDKVLSFKEFVCGLSALCRGPENARITCRSFKYNIKIIK